jgi:hypothetical protein
VHEFWKEFIDSGRGMPAIAAGATREESDVRRLELKLRGHKTTRLIHASAQMTA